MSTVAPMNRCGRFLVDARCERQTCHTGPCGAVTRDGRWHYAGTPIFPVTEQDPIEAKPSAETIAADVSRIQFAFDAGDSRRSEIRKLAGQVARLEVERRMADELLTVLREKLAHANEELDDRTWRNREADRWYAEYCHAVVELEQLREVAKELDAECHGWEGEDRVSAPKHLFKKLRAFLGTESLRPQAPKASEEETE